MAIFRSLFGALPQGFLHALGFKLGMGFLNQAETRPILRKRKLASFVYGFLLVYCVVKSFSFQQQEQTAHAFVSLMGKFGGSVDGPFAFILVTGMFACLVLVVTLMVYQEDERKIGDIPSVAKATIMVGFLPFVYAVPYNTAFYLFGNSCVPFVGVPCLNVATVASSFAMSSVVVYIFRSCFLLRPEERGTIVFNSSKVQEFHEPGFHIIPTAPIPHTLYVALNTAYDIIPAFWDLYHHPDGRELAQQHHMK